MEYSLIGGPRTSWFSGQWIYYNAWPLNVFFCEASIWKVGQRELFNSIVETHFCKNILIYRIISAFDNRVVKKDVNGRPYDFTSFPAFVNMILDGANKKKCQLSTSCDINNHVRWVKACTKSENNAANWICFPLEHIPKSLLTHFW